MQFTSQKKLAVLLGATLALGSASALAQSTFLYAVGVKPGTNAPSTFRIDRTTGADSAVGALGDAATLPFGLAVSNGALYTFDGNTDKIRQIDLATGAYTGTPISIGTINLTGEGDIAFGAGGVGYITTGGVGATSNSPALYTFNLAGGTSSLVASTSDASGPLTIDGLAFNPSSSLLYAITAEDDRLYTLNSTTGFLTPVGAGLGFAPGSGFGALAFDNGTLYGIINDSLYTINTTSGVATPIGTGVDYGAVSGLAAIVPEPSTFILLGMGLTAFASRRKRWA